MRAQWQYTAQLFGEMQEIKGHIGEKEQRRSALSSRAQFSGMYLAEAEEQSA